MALRVFQFAAVIPAGTPPASPVTIDLELDNWSLEMIGLEVPPGAAGLMGFYIANNGVQWIPNTPGQFLVWDNNQNEWPLEGQPDASGWQVVGYNTGTYQHQVIVRMHVNPPVSGGGASTPPSITIVTSGVAGTEPVTL